MVNYNTIIVFDFETWSLDTAKLEPVSLAAVAIDPRSLRTKDRFKSLMRPLDKDNFDARAIEVNGLTWEKVKDAPEQKLVWELFAIFVKKHNKKGSPFFAPIPAGKNIRGFDLPIYERLCRTYGMVDKAGRPNLFNTRTALDLEDVLWLWFESSADFPNYKMDTLRPYFGLSTEGAHDAAVDVDQTAELLCRFLKLHRELKSKRQGDGTPMIRFEGACRKAV